MAILTGQHELIRKLEALPDKVFRRGLSSAGRKATRPVVVSAKAAVAVESGALKKSIGLRTKVYRQTGVMIFVVGPRSGFAGLYQGRKRDPRFYAHLVEGGHVVKIRAAGIVGKVAPKPFLKPALETNASVITATLGSALGAFITKEARKKA